MSRLSLIHQVQDSLREIGPAAVLHQLANRMREDAAALPSDAYGRAEMVAVAEQLAVLAQRVPKSFRFGKESE